MARENNIMLNVRDFGSNAVNRGTNAVGALAKNGKDFGNGFRKFITKGNVVELAVGLVMGTAFTAVVTSFVKDLITPVIGIASGASLEEMFVVIKGCKPNLGDNDPCKLSKTREEAAKNGLVTENYGNFLQVSLNFFLISFLMYMLIKVFAFISRPKPTPSKVKECPYCIKEIPLAATRCAFCTSQLPVEEPQGPAEQSESVQKHGIRKYF